MEITYTVKDSSKTEKELSATIPDHLFEEAKKYTINQLRQQANIKGFRPGKAPDNMVEQHYGSEYIELRSLDRALQLTYVEIIKKEKINACAMPEVHLDEKDPRKFTAKIPVLPEVEIKNHQDIKVPAEKLAVTKEELETIKNDLLRYGMEYKDVDRAAKKGDRAELEFEGFEGDKPVAGTKSSNHPVILGEGSLIPGFEEEVIGLKVGEEKDFEITFPKDYHAEDFRNKKLKFHVKLQRLEEGTEPELNKELIKRLTGHDQTPEEFLAEAEKNLLARKETEERARRENAYVEKLVEKLKIELPKALIAEEAQEILAEMKRNVEMRKMEFAAYLAQQKTTEEELLKKYHEEGERRIRIRLALQYVMREEGIQIDNKDLEAELATLKSRYPEAEHAKIDSDFAEGALRNQLANKLALQRLFDKVLA